MRTCVVVPNVFLREATKEFLVADGLAANLVVAQGILGEIYVQVGRSHSARLAHIQILEGSELWGLWLASG